MLLLLLGLLLRPAGLLGEGCSLEHTGGPTYGTVVGLRISGLDLIVDLVIAPAPVQGVRVALETATGQGLVAAPAQPDARDRAVVRLPNALAGATMRDVRYRLTASDATGRPVMAPYPFALLLDCPTMDQCTFEALPGIEVGGLLVTAALADALRDYPACQLPSSLEEIIRTRPELRRDAQTLQHQLNLRLPTPKAEGECTYDWHTTVPVGQTSWVTENLAFPMSGPHLEIGGLHSGPGHCYSLQADRPPASGTPVPFVRSGAAELEMGILCLSGPPSCAGGCGGVVELDMEYRGCSTSDADAHGTGSGASIMAIEQGMYLVNGSVLFHSTAEASATASYPAFATDSDFVSNSDLNTFAAPVSAMVWTEGSIDFSFGAGHAPVPVPGMPGLERMELPAGDRMSRFLSLTAPAYVFGEFNNTYRLAAEGTSSCTVARAVSARLVPPAFHDALSASRGGGIKIRRWRDQPGGGSGGGG